MSIPFIGSKINLISKRENRYEGILSQIDTENHTLALKNVKSYGTENRPTANPIKPQDTIWECILFRASDIKDIHVMEGPAETSQMDDPAIISSQLFQPDQEAAPKEQPEKQAAPSQQKTTPQQNTPMTYKDSLLSDFPAENTNTNNSNSDNHNRYQNNNRRGNRGQGNFFRGNRGNAQKGQGNRGPQIKADFNFEDAKILDKDELAQEFAQKSEEKEAVAVSYTPSSFFDNISCEATDRMSGQKNEKSLVDQRKIDSETFGAIGRTYHPQHLHRSNRGNRGNRGNNRGFNNYNKGNFQNNNNNNNNRNNYYKNNNYRGNNRSYKSHNNNNK